MSRSPARSFGSAAGSAVTVGTAAGTVAAGDDARITGAAQKAQNLADLASIATALANLGLDTDGTLAANSDAKFPSQKAIKSYVDAVAQGLSPKASVRAATAAALAASTYSGGVITASGNGALTVDGVTVAANDRVLVKNEGTASRNGIYKVTATGDGSNPFALTRSTDMDTGSEVPGAYVFVEDGTVNTGAGFVVASSGPFTIGSSSIAWTQFSGAGEITNGSGLLKSGNTLSVDTSTIATAASVTSEATARSTADGLLLAKADNLASLASASAGRTNLGLGGAAVLNVGTTAGTVAAGDDSRFSAGPSFATSFKWGNN